MEWWQRICVVYVWSEREMERCELKRRRRRTEILTKNSEMRLKAFVFVGDGVEGHV